jgi:hypothetical protein
LDLKGSDFKLFDGQDVPDSDEGEGFLINERGRFGVLDDDCQ